MSKWISVKRRLPEPEEYVLVYYTDNGGEGYWIASYNPKINKWYFRQLGLFSGVTHWRELPKPPASKPETWYKASVCLPHRGTWVEVKGWGRVQYVLIMAVDCWLMNGAGSKRVRTTDEWRPLEGEDAESGTDR